MDNRFSISIESYPFSNDLPYSFNLDPGSLYCVCKGELLGQDKKAVVEVGDTERGGYLKQLGNVGVNQETILMKFVVYD